MIGTLIGLIIMLQNLQDTSQIGTGMAVAMLTTLYGSVLANMIAIPLAEKVYRGIEDLYTEEVCNRSNFRIVSWTNPF